MLRIGHRPKRDVRVTTHVALVARAFGCSGFFLEGDDGYLNSIRGILRKWGGVGDFELETVKSPRSLVKSWRRDGGVVIHLTMYGMNIIDKESAIREIERPILIVVGAGKVSRWYVIFPGEGSIRIERPERFGGDVDYHDYGSKSPTPPHFLSMPLILLRYPSSPSRKKPEHPNALATSATCVVTLTSLFGLCPMRNTHSLLI